MRILAFSDWRIQPIDVLFEIIDDIENVDAIVYAGDDLDRLDNTFLFKNIERQLEKNQRSNRSYISKCSAEIFYYSFSEYPEIKSEDKLKELAISEINTKKCEIKSWIVRDILNSRFGPNDSQLDAIKYKLKVGIECGRVINVGGHEIIVFKLDSHNIIFPEVDFQNIFQALSEKANAPVLGVIGNDDIEEVGKAFAGDNIFNIHKNPAKVVEHYFMGIQGVICDDLSFKKREKERELNALYYEIEDFFKKFLLKNHQNYKSFFEFSELLKEIRYFYYEIDANNCL